MKNALLTLSLVLALGACGRGGEEKAPAQKSTEKPAEKAAPVRYDPAFKDIAGTWVSGEGSLDEGRILRIDVASGGGYSIDIRKPGSPDQVLETGRGNAKASEAGIVAMPDGSTAGATLKGLGSWRATVVEKKSMSLSGGDGKKIELTYKGL